MHLLDLSDAADRHIGRVLELQARHAGQRPFLLTPQRSFDFAETDSIVNRYANGLRALGVARGDRVVLLMGSSAEYVFLALAVNKLGAVWVPVNTDYRGEWLVGSINDSDARVLVTDEALLVRLAEVADRLQFEALVVDAPGPVSWPGDVGPVSLAALAEQPDDPPDMAGIRYEDTAAILWTSGTTGKSKGVMQSHNAWIRAAESGNRTFGIREGDVAYNCLPLYNSAAWVANILRALVGGLPCGLDPHFSASTFWDRVRFYGATQTLTLGAMHMFLWNAPERADDADNPLRAAQMIPMPDDLLGPFQQRFGIDSLSQGYGQSEIMALLVRGGDRQWKPYSLGAPLDDLEVRLLDDDGNEVGVDAVGEFCVRPKGPAIIFNGYFNNPEATAAAFHGEWYRTGDLGRRDADGHYFFVDRKSDFIRYKGRNVSSLQVEGVVMRHPAVKAAAVFGIPSDELASEAEIKLDVIVDPDANVTPEELARFINDNAPYFFVPRYIEIVEELPYTPTNKVQKFKLRKKGVTPATWDRNKTDFVIER